MQAASTSEVPFTKAKARAAKYAFCFARETSAISKLTSCWSRLRSTVVSVQGEPSCKAMLKLAQSRGGEKARCSTPL